MEKIKETLEEAAKKYCLINNIPIDQMIVKTDRSCEFETPITMFIAGAQLKAERMYSKEELHKCKYCGVETTQPDEECYAKPAKELTAVDWLVENLSNHDKAIEIVEIIELANKMIEQQITNAYQKGFTRERGNRNEDAKQYYSETYKADEI